MTTSLSISEARADLIAKWVTRAGDEVRTIADVKRLPHVSGWHPTILADAIDRNLATGRFITDETGRLTTARSVDAQERAG